MASVHRFLLPLLAASALLLAAALPARAQDSGLDPLQEDLPPPDLLAPLTPKPAPSAPDPFGLSALAPDPFAPPLPVPDASAPHAERRPPPDLLERDRQTPRTETFPPDTRSIDRMEGALVELRKELSAAEAKGDAAAQARILGNMGTLYMLMGRDNESLDALYRGAAIEQTLGDAEKLAELQILIDTVTNRTTWH
jgi:hypothetical protein